MNSYWKLLFILKYFFIWKSFWSKKMERRAIRLKYKATHSNFLSFSFECSIKLSSLMNKGSTCASLQTSCLMKYLGKIDKDIMTFINMHTINIIAARGKILWSHKRLTGIFKCYSPQPFCFVIFHPKFQCFFRFSISITFSDISIDIFYWLCSFSYLKHCQYRLYDFV